MIDFHSHVWDITKHFSEAFYRDGMEGPGRRGVNLSAHPEQHWEQYRDFPGKTVVFGLRSEALGINVPDEFVAEYVHSHSDKLIGFMSVDPASRGMEAQIKSGMKMGLRGIKTSSIYAMYHPAEEKPMKMYSYAYEYGLPVITHQSSTFSKQAPLKYGPASLLDDVMIRFPELKIIIPHFGYPWEKETLHFIRKYPHAYVDLSAVHYRPWEFYNTLLMYSEWNYLDRVLLGSDYPFTTIQETLATLRRVNQFVRGTALPRIPEEEVERIIQQDSLKLFSLDQAV